MQCVYVVCDSEWGGIARMTWVSVQSLKKMHPDWSVTLVVDRSTSQRLQESGRLLLAAVDRVVVVEPNCLDLKTQSRWIKVRIGEFVKGTFLFLDSDTLVLRSLKSLQSEIADIAAVTDNSLTSPAEAMGDRIRSLYEGWGWPTELPFYFNSGVIRVQGGEGSEEVFRQWTQLWEFCRQKEFVFDQPAFNMAVFKAGVSVSVLPREFNSIVMLYPQQMRDARIAHFYQSSKLSGSLLDHLVDVVDREGRVDWKAIEEAVRCGLPWAPDPEPWQLWWSGQYLRAIWAKLSSRQRRVRKKER